MFFQWGGIILMFSQQTHFNISTQPRMCSVKPTYYVGRPSVPSNRIWYSVSMFYACMDKHPKYPKSLFKGQTWLRVYCWCKTPEGVKSRLATKQHRREFDTINIRTIMFDPDYNMMPPIFFRSCQYSAHLKQLTVWIESNLNPRCCVTM